MEGLEQTSTAFIYASIRRIIMFRCILLSSAGTTTHAAEDKATNEKLSTVQSI